MTMDSEQSWDVLNALLKIETAAELTAIMAETDAGKAARLSPRCSSSWRPGCTPKATATQPKMQS